MKSVTKAMLNLDTKSSADFIKFLAKSYRLESYASISTFPTLKHYALSSHYNIINLFILQMWAKHFYIYYWSYKCKRKKNMFDRIQIRLYSKFSPFSSYRFSCGFFFFCFFTIDRTLSSILPVSVPRLPAIKTWTLFLYWLLDGIQ